MQGESQSFSRVGSPNSCRPWSNFRLIHSPPTTQSASTPSAPAGHPQQLHPPHQGDRKLSGCWLSSEKKTRSASGSCSGCCFLNGLLFRLLFSQKVGPLRVTIRIVPIGTGFGTSRNPTCCGKRWAAPTSKMTGPFRSREQGGPR
jgi:hypothetical protein